MSLLRRVIARRIKQAQADDGVPSNACASVAAEARRTAKR